MREGKSVSEEQDPEVNSAPGRRQDQAQQQSQQPQNPDDAPFASPSGPPADPVPVRRWEPVRPVAGYRAPAPVPPMNMPASASTPTPIMPPAYPSAPSPSLPPPAFPAGNSYPTPYPAFNSALNPLTHPAYQSGPLPRLPVPDTHRRSTAGQVITGLLALVLVTGLALGVLTRNNDKPAATAAADSSGGSVPQATMCQTIAVASDGDGPGSIPTMPGGEQDLTAMQAAEVQVYQWASQTENGTLKNELEQENSDAQQFISDFNADPEADEITPTGVLSIDMSTFTIDQSKVDATCGINTDDEGGLSA